MAANTSFQRKTRAKIDQIQGVKRSLQNSQLLASTGVPSFDSIVGGGIAVGSVVLVEEDVYGSYSKLLMKYYLAEAILCGHSIYLASAHTNPESLLQELPGPILDEPTETNNSSNQSESLQIAWRYQDMPKVQPSTGGSKFGHYYDLTKTMAADLVQATDKTFYQPDSIEGNDRYTGLLQSIQRVITEGQFSTSDTVERRNILRIGLPSLGSPLWGENGTDNSYDPALPQFLFALRSLLRSAFAVCYITIPTHLLQDSSFRWRIEKLCDTVVCLESFAGSEGQKNQVYADYHGLFHIVSLPRLNSINSHLPDTLDWGFKLKRKKFTIEKLHLPPELSETASRTQEDPISSQGCGGTAQNNKLDF